MFSLSLALIAVLLGSVYCAPVEDLIANLPNLVEPLRSKNYAGYLNISADKQLFYWYIESENDPANDPVVLWLNGGPGCSSLEGTLLEMGPFRVFDQGKTVARNPWTWNRLANIIYLDAPAGVGFSFYNTTKKTFNDDQVASDNHDALVLWFQKFPERKNNSFFVAGESYGGTYVPTLSSLILDKKQFPSFQGMLIGNGCLDDSLLFNSGILYDYYHGLTDETQFRDVINSCCDNSIACDFYKNSFGFSKCANMTNDLSESKYYSGLDPYFLYFKCYLNEPNYDRPDEMKAAVQERRETGKPSIQKRRIVQKLDSMPSCAHHNDYVAYLNMPEVRTALRIPSYIQNYSSCSNVIAMKYVSQYTTMTPFFQKIMKAKKRITLFNGDVDSMCNVVHNQQFIKNLNRTLLMPSTPYVDYKQIPSTIGLQTKYDGVELVTIVGGGHFPAVLAQKPKETFQMFSNFLRNKSYSTQVDDDKPPVGKAAGYRSIITSFLMILITIFLQFN